MVAMNECSVGEKGGGMLPYLKQQSHTKTVHCYAHRSNKRSEKKLSFRTDDAGTDKVICRKRYVAKCCLEVQGGA